MIDEARALPCPLCGRSDLVVQVIAQGGGTQLADLSPARVEERRMCRVCYSEVNDEGYIRHGKGCYKYQEEGGGDEYIGIQTVSAAPARVEGGEDVQLHIGRLAAIGECLSELGYSQAVYTIDGCIAIMESLSAQLAAVKDDAERLDWLVQEISQLESCYLGLSDHKDWNTPNYRAAIDAARKP